MKNIRLRKDGRWEGRKQHNKQKFYVIASTKEKCIKKYKELLKDIKNQSIEKNSCKYTLKEWYEDWKENYKKPFISESSYKSIITAFNLLFSLDKSLAETKIKNLTTDKIQRLYNQVETSRKKEIMILYLNACMNMAKKLGYINFNPVEDITKDRKLKKIRKALTYDEQVKLFNKLKSDVEYSPLLVYLFCGIRKKELNNIDIQNDIMADNTLRIICEKKRDKEPIYRYIDLTERTKNLILSNLKYFNKSHDWYSKTISKIMKELNINGSLHTLRHTFTTNHLYFGTPSKFIQDWLGHEELNITIKHYMGIDRSLTKEKLLNLYEYYYYIIKT